MAHGQAGAEVAVGHGPTLTCNHEAPIVAFDCKGSQVQHDESGATPTLRAMGHAESHANAGGQLAVAHALRAEGFDASEDGTGRGTPIVPVAMPLTADMAKSASRMPHDDRAPTASVEVCGTLETVKQHHVALPWAVRRLTPRECERLQGFPDDFTLVPWRRALATDGPRYKALGNSWAVNCADWIGERIAAVEAAA